MKTINMRHDPQTIVDALEAARSGEAFISRGFVCHAVSEPTFTKADIESVSMESGDYMINSIERRSGHKPVKSSFFSSKNYDIYMFIERSRITLLKDNSKVEVIISIQTDTNAVLDKTKFDSMPRLERQKWLEEHSSSKIESLERMEKLISEIEPNKCCVII